MTRINEEKLLIAKMIMLYCRRAEGNREMCHDCRQLLEYAHARLERCRFGERKPTCRKCPIHCYRPDMKAKVRTVMRWAGPRMVIHHPVYALKHLLR